MEQESKKPVYVILIALFVLALVPIYILVFKGKQGSQSNVAGQLSLTGEGLLDAIGGKAGGEYSDGICKISFQCPKDWLKSDVILPLSQKPLSQVTFNEPAKGNSAPKNSILSFICYDAKKYSFDQFIGQSPAVQGQTETITAGNIKWQRLGNFIYTVKNDKLYILQMFFTKYDLKPEVGYEETFLNIIKSVRFLK